MYSGQEVVSQEKCRLLLANFYEGVVCIDYKSPDHENPVLSLTLQDAQTAEYDADTQTLTTVNFSVRPLIIAADTDFSYLFAAELPEGTTGLEVIMFAEQYQKIRIMPLYLVRTCDSYTWTWTIPPTDGDGDPFEWSYIKSICTNEDETYVVYQGKLDSLGSTSLKLVGNKFVEATQLELFKDGVAVSLNNAKHKTWETEIPVLDQYGATIKYTKLYEGSITIPVEADTAHITGSYDTTFDIRPCEYLEDERVFENLEFCYDKTTRSTKLIYPDGSMSPTLVPDSEGWYYVGDLRVRLK